MAYLMSQLPPPDLDSPGITPLLSQQLPLQAYSSRNELETIHTARKLTTELTEIHTAMNTAQKLIPYWLQV